MSPTVKHLAKLSARVECPVLLTHGVVVFVNVDVLQLLVSSE